MNFIFINLCVCKYDDVKFVQLFDTNLMYHAITCIWPNRNPNETRAQDMKESNEIYTSKFTFFFLYGRLDKKSNKNQMIIKPIIMYTFWPKRKKWCTLQGYNGHGRTSMKPKSRLCPKRSTAVSSVNREEIKWLERFPFAFSVVILRLLTFCSCLLLINGFKVNKK